MPSRLLIAVAVLGFAVSPAAAQNREHVEIFADLRMLHEQVQKLQLAVNALTEQLNGASAKLDKQSADALKTAADQKLIIDSMQSTMREISEQVGQSTVSVSRLNSEVKVLRDALTSQQGVLNQILAILQNNFAGGGSAAGGTPPPAGGGQATPPAGGASIAPSPSGYWDAAWSYWASSKYPEAIIAFTEFLKQFPDHPDAPRAQLNIGDAHFMLGKYRDAIAALQIVVSKYPNSEQVPEAYLKQAQSHQALKQNSEAIRLYELVINRYPKSDAAIFARDLRKGIK
jgi:tol-pal system protein YbgF